MKEITREEWNKFFATAAAMAIYEDYMDWDIKNMIDYKKCDKAGTHSAYEDDYEEVCNKMYKMFTETFGYEMKDLL